MAQLEHVFDTTIHGEERQDRTLLPDGIYPVIATRNDKKDSQSTPGNAYLEIEWTINEGPFKERKLWDRLNLWVSGTDEKAITTLRIARAGLTEICNAIGKTTISDGNEIMGHQVYAEVKTQPAKSYTKNGVQQPGQPSNTISKYYGPGNVPNGQAPAPAAMPAATPGKPWQRPTT